MEMIELAKRMKEVTTKSPVGTRVMTKNSDVIWVVTYVCSHPHLGWRFVQDEADKSVGLPIGFPIAMLSPQGRTWCYHVDDLMEVEEEGANPCHTADGQQM